jgi:hypothetical protein
MPNRIDTKKLCRTVGRRPFDERAHFNGGYAKCPLHDGDSNKSLHLVERDGHWLATCFSGCSRTWDAISFVMAVDKIEFLDAVAKLGGKETDAPASAPITPVEKPKPKAMTLEAWSKWGRELTPADVARLAASRKDKTASFEAFKNLGCRVDGDFIGFPCSRTIYDPENGLVEAVKFDLIRKRHMDEKDFYLENSVSQHGLFNLDTVNALEDVYVVEGEMDVAIMEEAGFRAVSVISGSQTKFDSHALETLKIAPRIFLVGDQERDDGPGQKCMNGLQKLLPFEKSFRVAFDSAKDVSALARKVGDGFASKIADFTEEALEPWTSKDGNVPSIDQLSTKEVVWVVDRMLPYGGLTMLLGSQGSMKSLFGMYLAKAVGGSATDFLGRKILRLPVMYIDRENPEGEVSKRARLTGILGMRDFQYWGDFNEAGFTPEPDDPRLFEFAHRRKGLIIFDSLQDWYGDASEIDNTAMVKLMGKFRKLARAGAGVLILHHQSKQSKKDHDKEGRGGTAITSLTDMAIASTKSEADQNVIELRESRFRMCGGWEIDFRAHWNAGEFHRHAPFYQLELLRDDDVADIRKEQGAAAREEAYRELQAKAEKLEQLNRLLEADPKMSIAAVAKELGTTRHHLYGKKDSLAHEAGWSHDDEFGWRKVSERMDGASLDGESVR